MTEYQNGRIYSGVDRYDERHTVMRINHDGPYVWSSGGDAWDEDGLFDIRGPLVVLDLDYSQGQWRLLHESLDRSGWNLIANQIEEQTHQPETGWHEVYSPDWGTGNTVRRWDGKWFNVPGYDDSIQNWKSVHFIGKASGDE